MIVGTLMTKTVKTVRPECSIADAARLMLAQHISGLPVLDEKNALIGMVTEGDLLRRAELGTDNPHKNWLMAFLSPSGMAHDYVQSHGRLVSEVMSTHPCWVTPEASLTAAADLMLKKRIKRLPVLQDGLLAGIISRADLLRALAVKLNDVAAVPPSGKMIHDYILGALAREVWAPKSGIRVTVDGSTVDLEGVIFSEDERQAVTVIAENAPGVAKVNDHLMYVDAGSGMAFPGP